MYSLARHIYPLSLRARITCKLYQYFPNAFDKNVRLAIGNNVKLDLSGKDYGHKSMIFNGFYELGLTHDIVRLAKKGGLLVDVGANYGYYTCLWAAQHPGNMVVAFEASPNVFKPLKENIFKNQLQYRVHLVAAGAGKENGILQFSFGSDTGQTSWGGFTVSEDLGAVEVPVITLDDYAARHGINKIDVLKIDTEGADTWVLMGAKWLLKEKRINHIFFEHNAHRMGLLGIEPNEATDFLTGLGYIVKKYYGNDFYAFPAGAIDDI